jgi:hypothetical protein
LIGTAHSFAGTAIHRLGRAIHERGVAIGVSGAPIHSASVQLLWRNVSHERQKELCMSMSPKDKLQRVTDVLGAWSTARPSKSFGGMTLEQFRQTVQASIDVRKEIAMLDARRAALVVRRDDLDAAALDAAARAVHGVKGDPDEGEDGELYATMGFVRKSLRRSGLTRRKRAASVAQPKEVDHDRP